MESVAGQVHVGANPDLRTGSLIAGMLAGADTVDGMDVLADGDTLAFVDVDSVRQVFGVTKQDAAFGHAKINAASARETGVPDMILVRTDSAYCKVERATGSIVEVPYTAFAAKRAHRTGGRPMVRRVERLNCVAAAQSRGHAVAD